MTKKGGKAAVKEFTHHKHQQTLQLLRILHIETLSFATTYPDATLADFEQHLRKRVDSLEEEAEEGERAAQVAVMTRPLSGPLADPERQRAFREAEASQPYDNGQREAWWKQRTAVFDEIKAQGIKEALDWDCRDCGAAIGQPCHTAGGRRRDPHFLRATDAELPYRRAYGLG